MNILRTMFPVGIALLFPLLMSGQAKQPATKKEPAKKVKTYGKDFFEKDSIHTIKINFVQCNYWDSLVLYKEFNDSLEGSFYMQATVRINDEVFYSCGVRFKGESSYEFYPGKKKPFRLKFDKYHRKKDFDGLEELNLTNNFKDPTMLREKIYLDILNSEGLPAPRATFAKVYLNDKYWGLYLVNENIDDKFLETRFNDDRGNLFQGEPLANFVYLGNDQAKYYNKYVLKSNKKQNDWSGLVKFIRLINDSMLSEEEYIRKLETTFNLDKCLRAWAINNLIGNIDAYNMFYPHNFFIYHDSILNKWNWISLDGNYSFAAWNPILPLPALTRMSVMIPDSVPYKDARPLYDNTLKKNRFIQRRYLAIAKEMYNKYFEEEKFNAMIDSLALRIRVSVYADPHKMYSNSDFDTNISSTIGDPLDPGNFIPGLKSFIAERRPYIEEELERLSRELN